MISVLVVEDSRVTREYLIFALEGDSEIQVCGAVGSGEEALQRLRQLRPDVILMDIHLPGIDGFETTRRIMATSPVPIVACTASIHFDQVHTAMQALEAGALTVLKKPRGLGAPGCDVDTAAMVQTVKLMAEVKVVRRWTRPQTPVKVACFCQRDSDRREIVAIGASTGGPPVVSDLLSALPRTFSAPILVVQHISAGFTVGFVEWLGSLSALPVHLARSGDRPQPGHVYVAPDDEHLRVSPTGLLQTNRDDPHQGLRPSVSVLFRSVAEVFGKRAIGVILTGMGRDGADGLKLMAERGALTVAQDEASSVVFGMPAEAIRLGAARFILPPPNIAGLLTSAVQRPARNEEIDD